MKGDFSRISFDATKHFSSVLRQQGRVMLDADHNESTAILLHYMRTLARDLLGSGAGPADNLGFQLEVKYPTDNSPPFLNIGKGRYYVDGILVEIDHDCDYAKQPYRHPDASDPLPKNLSLPDDQGFWIYVDVWERHVTWLEDDSIREVALDGPDTCTRTKVVWQVRAIRRSATVDNVNAPDTNREQLLATLKEIKKLEHMSTPHMAARVDPGQGIKDPCTIAADALYRGAENQLYRVEIHRGGRLGDKEKPTFKWSRDNGSIATHVLRRDGNDLFVTNTRGFKAGAWAEVFNKSDELAGQPGILVKIVGVASDRLNIENPKGVITLLPSLNSIVRQWDQTENGDVTFDPDDHAIPIVEGEWLPLEDGIQVKFEKPSHGNATTTYRTGDYWWIAARAATGSIIWPTMKIKDNIKWLPKPPDGVEHHYAPLGYLYWNGNSPMAGGCRNTIERPVALANVDQQQPRQFDAVTTKKLPASKKFEWPVVFANADQQQQQEQQQKQVDAVATKKLPASKKSRAKT